MAILHAKCTVCGGSVYRFGGRRRRCSRCGRTWSIRRKKRGRKVARTGIKLPELILLEHHTARQLTSRYRCSVSRVRYRARGRIETLIESPDQVQIPSGDLVLLVDGLWFTFQGQRWVLYDMAIKPVSENVAYFFDPIQRPGPENAAGWNAAIDTLPWDVIDRTRALISDGLAGFEAIARRYLWVNQFCHRHLIAALESKLGRHRRQLGSRWLRERIYAAVREALTTSDTQRLKQLEERIKQLIGRWDCTRSLRSTVNHFLKLQDSFRAYLRYPELNLPTTTNTMESMHNLLRDAIGSVNNPESACARATGLIRLHRTITCNGHSLQQN
jgi:hypothetical protein